MQIANPEAVSDITPAMSAWMEENDKPAFAKYEAAKAGLAALKAANGSTANVLLQVTKLLLELAPDSPQRTIVQTMYDTFQTSPAKAAIVGTTSPEPVPQPAPVAPEPQPQPEPAPAPEPQLSPEPPPAPVAPTPPAAPQPVQLTAQVTGLTVVKSGDNHIATWDAVPGADTYELWWSTAQNPDGQTIKGIVENSLTVPTAQLPPDQITFAVLAANSLGRSKNPADQKDFWSADTVL